MDPDFVFDDPLDVTPRLEALGLTEALLRDAVLFGLQYAETCTRNDVPNLRGHLQWAKCVRFLRDNLKDWKPDNDRNYPTIIHPRGEWQVAVSSGDENTGIDRHGVPPPRSRNPKGPVTKLVVFRNSEQMVLAIEFGSDPKKIRKAPRQTWILLYHVDIDAKVIRLELSRPASMSADSRLADWWIRLILQPITLDPSSLDLTEDLNDDEGYEVPVDRRG